MPSRIRYLVGVLTSSGTAASVTPSIHADRVFVAGGKVPVFFCSSLLFDMLIAVALPKRYLERKE
jgi:hypothetical protein